MSRATSSWRLPVPGVVSGPCAVMRKRPGPVRYVRTAISGQPKRSASCAGAIAVMASIPKKGTVMPLFIF